MNDRKVLVVAGITLLSVWVLSMGWEFGVEPLLQPFFGSHHGMDPGDRLKHVAITTILAGIALVTPLFLLLHFVHQNANTETALEESEERYRNLIEMSPNAIIVVQDNQIVYSNSAANLLLRATNETGVVGLTPRQLTHRSSIEYLERFRSEIWERGILPLTEVNLVRFDHTVMPSEVVSAAITYGGKPAAQAIIFDVTRRKTQERQINSELHFRQILMENLPYPVFHKNRRGIYTGCNSAFLEHFGKSMSQVVGKTVFDIAPNSLATRNHETDIALIESRGKQTYETQMIHADGTLRDVIVSKTTFFDAEGKTGGLIGTFIDITDRKADEVALLRANRALKALSLCNQALVHEYDPDQLLNEICRIITEEAGYRMSWIGMVSDEPTPRIIPKAMAGHIDGYLDNIKIVLDDGPSSKGPVGKVIRTGKPSFARDIATELDFELWRDAALERGYASASVYPLFGENDRVIGSLMVYADDTGAFDEDEVHLLTDLANNVSFGLRALKLESERKLVEQDLHKLSRAMGQSPAIVIITDASWIIEYVNMKFTEITGQKSFDMIGRSLRVVNMVWGFESDAAEITQAIQKTGEWRGEVSAKNPLKQQIFLQISIADIRDLNGNITNYLITAEDITERKTADLALREAKEEAEAANRTKSQFLANISHELRTPLNAVIGFSDILRVETYGPLGDQQYMESVLNINEAGHQLLGLINDLIDISRVDIGQLTLREMNMDPTRVVRSCGRLVKDRLDTNEISLNIDIPEDLPALYADEQRLKQIILNMLSNAIKFTPIGGSIGLSVCLDQRDQFVFTISDTGIGIAREDMERVMTVFGQVEASLSRNYDGIGLGLPLSRELTEAHNGTFTLQSEVGKGTTAIIKFPAERTIRFDE